ncbi:MAG TPA: hypothetical protein VEU30_06195 [Thermoanaerobaculia bacterium]|nr:hypothetical protein [Thermoanaerobaculia bacterium]
MIAVVFLLLAVADLAFPQICGEDSEPLFPARTAASAVIPADDPGEPEPAPARAEDCFCCCSHIVAEDSPSPLGQLAIVSGSGRIAPPSVPIAPVQVLFHPPRLA